jgi:Ni/Fe-hydrogenase subunit HybB-like protein
MQTQARPVGGPLFTRSFLILVALAELAGATIVWRFAAGLGATTALNDGYPWGLWIAFDVVTGTALACGGYAMALLVYIFNKGKYHPLIRPAILTSALGYSIAGFSVVIDIGRPWMAWKLPLFINHWNLNSALLEVALCIMAYCVVLYIELTPAILEKFKGQPNAIGRIADKALPVFDKLLIFIVALGMLLPTMHQSSLGSLMMLTGPRMHPLWFSPLLPLLFLIGCVMMGFAIVVFEATFSSKAFGHKPDTPMLRQLAKVSAWCSLLFVVVRFADLSVRGSIAYAFAADKYAFMFWVEFLCFIAPVVILLTKTKHYSLGNIFRQAILLAVGGALYRFDAYLLAFQPGPGWYYFPSVPEIVVTVGLVAAEVAIYVFVVKKFPIVAAEPAH